MSDEAVNPAELLRKYASEIVQRPLTDEENAHFDRMRDYCNEPVDLNDHVGRPV